MAEFLGEMKLENCQLFEIQGIGSAVLKAMLQFICTDAVPELDVKPDAASDDSPESGSAHRCGQVRAG
jgi:hypothetical protein